MRDSLALSGVPARTPAPRLTVRQRLGLAGETPD